MFIVQSIIRVSQFDPNITHEIIKNQCSAQDSPIFLFQNEVLAKLLNPTGYSKWIQLQPAKSQVVSINQLLKSIL